MNNKAYFFSVDAIICLTIITATLIVVSNYYVSEDFYDNKNYLSQDFSAVLSELQLSEVDNDYVSSLIGSGDIVELNNSIMEQIGEFWAEGDNDKASALFINMTYGIMPSDYNIGLKLDDEEVYSSASGRSISSGKKLISGISKDLPTRGYMSKAWARKVVKDMTQFVTLSPEGAGWGGSSSDRGEVEITKYFEVPLGANITDVLLSVSVHNDVTGGDWEIIDINDGQCTFDRDDLDLSSEGIFDQKDATGCVNTGQNSILFRLRNMGYNAHLHPGTSLRITYSLIEVVEDTEYSENVTQRFYFDNVLSKEGNGDGSGAWAMLPFYIPEDATSVSGALHVNVQEVDDILDRYYSSGWKYQDAYDIQLYLNSDSVFWQDNPSASSDINDGYYNGTYDYSNTFDITSELITGTNVVSLYVNNYGDTVGGDGDTVIYSDPFNDPLNSSYVEISYLREPEFIFGTVSLTDSQEFGGSSSYIKDTSFDFPMPTLDILNVFAHVIQQYSYAVDAYTGLSSPASNFVFSSPSARAVPSDIYLPKSGLSTVSTNYIRVRDENSGNDILPESSIEYSYLINSQVGYGSIFATQEEAVADAMDRLNTTIGESLILLDIETESTDVSGIPSMWGPVIAEVLIW